MGGKERVERLCEHLEKGSVVRIEHTANEGVIPDVNTLTPPPIGKADNGFFPKFQEMLRDYKNLGGVFSYEIIAGKRITIIADPELYEVVFSPDAMGSTPGIGDAVKVEMDKLAHAWFGIPRGICSYTIPSLDAVRKAIGPMKVVALADKVGASIEKEFAKLGNTGEVDLVTISDATFWGVNQAMFGAQTINPEQHGDAMKWFHQFDKYIPQVTGGMPPKMFDEMQEAAAKIVKMFEDSIKAGNHLNREQCPVLHDRYAPIPNEAMESFGTEEKAKFMISLFWAPQANTLPMTFWTLAHILADPRIKAKVEEEVRRGKFKDAPYDGHYPAEADDLPYVNACMRETLRLYIANLTHRHVSRDIPVKTSDGRWYKIPKDDMLSVASYIAHYNPDIYENPHEFRPERWAEEKHKISDYYPFALGKWSCSGKFLAQLEIPMLVALFFRDFDADLITPMPVPNWDEVVASVRPVGWPYDIGCRIKYSRRTK